MPTSRASRDAAPHIPGAVAITGSSRRAPSPDRAKYGASPTNGQPGAYFSNERERSDRMRARELPGTSRGERERGETGVGGRERRDREDAQKREGRAEEGGWRSVGTSGQSPCPCFGDGRRTADLGALWQTATADSEAATDPRLAPTATVDARTDETITARTVATTGETTTATGATTTRARGRAAQTDQHGWTTTSPRPRRRPRRRGWTHPCRRPGSRSQLARAATRAERWTASRRSRRR